jgi:menaquinone-dependent protoporphyrinogen oxidase
MWSNFVFRVHVAGSASAVKILVLFSSTEGQTEKVARHIVANVQAAGHEAAAHNMGGEHRLPPVRTFDAVIAAASVHQGYHQESAVNLATAQATNLNAMHSAFISVSLAAAMPEGRAEAQSYVDRFVASTGWKPKMTLLLAGAVRLSGYDYFERQVMKYIVLQRGVAHDLDVDYECTDWGALDGFVSAFLKAAPKSEGAVA